MASLQVQNPVGTLGYNWQKIFNEIAPRNIPQHLGTQRQIKVNELKPLETNIGAVGHNLGDNPTSTSFLFNGNPLYLQISIDFYIKANTANTAYYTSDYQLSNFIRRITVQGGEGNATLADMDGITAGLFVPRALFSLDVSNAIGYAGSARHPGWPFTAGGAQIPYTTNGPGSGNNVTHLAWDFYVPFSRHSGWQFGSPQTNNNGTFAVNIWWNRLFGNDLRTSPFGYIKTGGGADTNPFTLVDMAGNPSTQINMCAFVKGVTAPKIPRNGLSTADTLTTEQARALYGQRLFTVTSNPQGITELATTLNLKGNHLLSNLAWYFDFARPIATSGVGYGPQAITGWSWGEDNFFFTSGYGKLGTASGQLVDLYAGDARSFAGISWLENNGIDIGNGFLWPHKDNPGGTAGATVMPTTTLDYTNIDQYPLDIAVNNITNLPRITIIRQYYELVEPVLS